MKTLTGLLVAATLSGVALASPPSRPLSGQADAPAGMPGGHPAMGAPGAAPGGHGMAAGGHGGAEAADAQVPNKKGKVLTVLDAKTFTYLEIEDGGKKQWLAAPALAVKVGDKIAYVDAQVQPKFHSNLLNRDFTNLVMTTRAVVEK